jgi:hypothetical protein
MRVEASTLPTATLQIGGAAIQVEFAEGNFDLPRTALLDRVTRAACAVSIYYGRFPVPRYRLLIVPIVGRRGVLTGTTWGFGGAHSRILIGEHATITDLNDDWVITHEMVHTAFPSVAREHHWIEEGIATYVEPLARSWVRDYPQKKVWGDLVFGLPKGMPAAGDAGLDRSNTWGRTYWGGAMFCVLADVEIRQRTNCKRGLIDALRGVLAASGGIESDWPLDRALKAGDDAVGVPVLEELYAQMKSTPMSPDLATLWKRLGVQTKADDTALDDLAPEAAIRWAISAPPADAANNCGRGEHRVRLQSRRRAAHPAEAKDSIEE